MPLLLCTNPAIACTHRVLAVPLLHVSVPDPAVPLQSYVVRIHADAPIVSNRDQSLPPPCCKTLPAQIAAMPNSSFAYQCLSACSPCRTCPIVTSRICCCTLLVRSVQINCSTNPLYALPGPCLSNPNHSESASAILFRRRSFRHLSTAVLAKSFAMP